MYIGNKYVLYACRVTIKIRRQAHPIESENFQLFAYAKSINSRPKYIY